MCKYIHSTYKPSGIKDSDVEYDESRRERILKLPNKFHF